MNCSVIYEIFNQQQLNRMIADLFTSVRLKTVKAMNSAAMTILHNYDQILVKLNFRGIVKHLTKFILQQFQKMSLKKNKPCEHIELKRLMLSMLENGMLKL